MYIQYTYITNLKLHSPIRQRVVVETYTIYHMHMIHIPPKLHPIKHPSHAQLMLSRFPSSAQVCTAPLACSC